MFISIIFCLIALYFIYMSYKENMRKIDIEYERAMKELDRRKKLLEDKHTEKMKLYEDLYKEINK